MDKMTRFMQVLNSELNKNFREDITKIIKANFEASQADGFIKNKPDGSDQIEKTLSYSVRKSDAVMQVRRKTMTQMKASRDKTGDYESSNEAEKRKNRTQVNISALKSQERHSSDSDISRSLRKTQIVDRNESYYQKSPSHNLDGHSVRENLKMISEECINIDGGFYKEHQDGDLTNKIYKRRMIGIADRLNVSTGPTNQQSPKGLTKAGTLIIEPQSSVKRHKRIPSSGQMELITDKELVNLNSHAGEEYMLSTEKLKSPGIISFRHIGQGSEFKAKVFNLQTTVSSLFRKKLRTSFYYMLLIGSRARSRLPSVKDTPERLQILPDLSKINFPNLESTPGFPSIQILSPKIQDTERTISFRPEHPISNKDIEYSKVIIVARLLIRLQHNCDVLTSQALHQLSKLNVQDHGKPQADPQSRHLQAKVLARVIKRNQDGSTKKVLGQLRHAALVQKLANVLKLRKSDKRSEVIKRVIQIQISKVYCAIVRLEVFMRECRLVELRFEQCSSKKRQLIVRLVKANTYRLVEIIKMGIKEMTSRYEQKEMISSVLMNLLRNLCLNLNQKRRSCVLRLVYFARHSEEISLVRRHLKKSVQITLLKRSQKMKLESALSIFKENSNKLTAVNSFVSSRLYSAHHLKMVHALKILLNNNYMKTLNTQKQSRIHEFTLRLILRLSSSLISKCLQSLSVMQHHASIHITGHALTSTHRLVGSLSQPQSRKLRQAMHTLRSHAGMTRAHIQACMRVCVSTLCVSAGVRRCLQAGLDAVRRESDRVVQVCRESDDREMRGVRGVCERVVGAARMKVLWGFWGLRVGGMKMGVKEVGVMYWRHVMERFIESRYRHSCSRISQMVTSKNKVTKVISFIETNINKSIMFNAISKLKRNSKYKVVQDKIFTILNQLFVKKKYIDSSLAIRSLFLNVHHSTQIVNSLRFINLLIESRLRNAFDTISTHTKDVRNISTFVSMAILSKLRSVMDKLKRSSRTKLDHALTLLILRTSNSRHAIKTSELTSKFLLNTLQHIFERPLRLSLSRISIHKPPGIYKYTHTHTPATSDQYTYTHMPVTESKASMTDDRTQVYGSVCVWPIELQKDWHGYIVADRPVISKQPSRKDVACLTDRGIGEGSEGMYKDDLGDNEGVDKRYSYTERLFGARRPSDTLPHLQNKRLTGGSQENDSKDFEGSYTTKAMPHEKTDIQSVADFESNSKKLESESKLTSCISLRCVLEPFLKHSKREHLETALCMIYIQSQRERVFRASAILFNFSNKVQRTYSEARSELSKIAPLSKNSLKRREHIKNRILVQRLCELESLILKKKIETFKVAFFVLTS